MHPVVSEIWAITEHAQWIPTERLDQARGAWDSHMYKATWSACAMAVFAVQQMAGGTEDDPAVLRPRGAPAEVLAVLGDRARGNNAAHATWNLVAGIAVSSFEGLRDPFLKRELQDVSRGFKGSGVYMFAWWAHSAIARIAHDRPDTLIDDVAQIVARLEELA